MTLHSFALNLGSLDPLSKKALKDIKYVMEALDVEFLSEHLCWNGFNQNRFYELLPMPHDRVKQIHLSDAPILNNVYFDFHSGPVDDPVLELYDWYTKNYGLKTTNIEWDNKTPTFDIFQTEVDRIKSL